ncbi:Coiled-coil domain-containing protein 61 [Gaertneriomyces sp. JEL0708]|nr:Coiled-coil domain-containing protein 61 [Gaertneriomyces sp. JEL0708]
MGIGSLGSFSEKMMVNFKGRQCQLSISGSVDAGPGDCGVLTVQLEDVENGYKWAGAFSAAGIEEITTKTGNFKRFTVFVEMLLSSFSKSSQTVHLDFLTIDDLRSMANDHAQKSSGSNQKVYLVLTYAVAFDRVHYPLPMNLETSDSPDGGATAWTQNMPMHSVEPLKRMQEISNLLRENDRLKYELKIATSQASSVQSPTRHFNEHGELETSKNLQSLAQDAVKAAKREYKRFFDRNSALRHRIIYPDWREFSDPW